jgi:hypothetical protein
MDELHCDAGLDRSVPPKWAELRGDLSEQRPVSLAPGAEEVLRNLGEERRIRRRDLPEAAFYGIETGPDAFDRYEITEDGSFHGRRLAGKEPMVVVPVRRWPAQAERQKRRFFVEKAERRTRA